MSNLFNRKPDDCTDLGNVIKNRQEGKRGVELVMAPNGEMVAVPDSQADSIEGGTRAGTIAGKDYYSKL